MPLPPWHPDADIIGLAYLSRMAEMDLAFQLKIRELNRRLSLFTLVRMDGCSGFRMTTVLRHYFYEYLNRMMKHGPYSLPISVNIVEAFLTFNPELMVFDIRK
jgi:hypothetical protein